MSDWSLRPGLVGFGFGLIFLSIAVMFAANPVEFANEVNDWRAQVRDDVDRSIITAFAVAGSVCLLYGVLRAALYSRVAVSDAGLTVDRRLGFVGLSRRSWDFPVRIYLVRVVKDDYSDTGSRVVFVGDPYHGSCIAGFRTESEALEWIELLDPERFVVAEGVVERPLSPIHFP